MISFIDLSTGAEMLGCGSSVLCLGTFDGVHKGHAELVRRTLEMRDAIKAEGVKINGGAWCFRQPPAAFLSKDPCKQISSLDEKLEIFKEMGLDFVAVGDFNELKDVEARNFMRDILKDRCGCRGVVCGFNFTFGKGGLGTPGLLAEEFGDSAVILSPITRNGSPISSSEIRRLIANGEAELVRELMGRPYSVSSQVIAGKKLGRQLGFPTVNQIVPSEKILPRAGVYATKALVDGEEYNSVTNVGSNPTVENTFVRCETHIIGYRGDLYGRTVKISFFKFLRAEQKFDSVEELVRAIEENVKETKKYFEI